MGKIEKILKKGPVEGQTTEVYPVTSTKAVYDENNKRLDNIITGLQESVYLNTPIPISTENTPESMAQNVKNIADYVEKAKAAGIASVNGMGVTCLINNDYSGVGYLNGDTNITICGIKIFDDSSNPMYFSVDPDGTYGEVQIIMENSVSIVTSDMLVEGARRPIILTPDTTEVDEETYQKLLSDDVDVVFKTAQVNLYTLASKYDGDTSWYFYFTCFSCEGDTADDIYISAYEVNIAKTTPHICTIKTIYNDITFNQLTINAAEINGVVNKSTLSPVLQEIDLRGTDAERKAKLDQFEADWKALTGAGDLEGARFVGRYEIDYSVASILFTYSYILDNYVGISTNESYRIYEFILDRNGSLTITPLFSHLEAITIYTDNTPEHKQANLDNIAAYKANLEALGVDTTKGWNAPVKVNAINGISPGIFASTEENPNTPYTIISGLAGEYPYITRINKTSGESTMWEILCDGRNYARITTTSKSIISAINEVNALAKGYSTIFTPIELTAETAQNKTAIDARVAAFTAQGISLTNGCCIPVTYKGVYAGNISLINGDWYGLLVKNTNNPADNINIKLSADGTITEGNSVQ